MLEEVLKVWAVMLNSGVEMHPLMEQVYFVGGGPAPRSQLACGGFPFS